MTLQTSCTIDDIEVGKIYVADFSGITTQIPPKNATQPFIKKYSKWSDLTGKRVLVLEKTTASASSPYTSAKAVIPVLKFAVMPINTPEQNKIDTSGEWCLCSARYLYKQQTKNHASCTCNLWITGCTCGIFKAEQSKKK